MACDFLSATNRRNSGAAGERFSDQLVGFFLELLLAAAREHRQAENRGDSFGSHQSIDTVEAKGCMPSRASHRSFRRNQ